MLQYETYFPATVLKFVRESCVTLKLNQKVTAFTLNLSNIQIQTPYSNHQKSKKLKVMFYNTGPTNWIFKQPSARND